MADNIQVRTGGGGDTKQVAADELGGGLKVAYTKPAGGSDGKLSPLSNELPYTVLIASNQMPGYSMKHLYGENADIDIGTEAIGDVINLLSATEIMNIVSSSANDRGVTTGTLTLTGNAADTETVIIGTKTYTFQDVLTDVDGNVLVGATASDSIDNLIAAITLGAGSGTLYAASTTAGQATAAAGDGDTMVVTDPDGSLLATTETLANGSFGAATLSAGSGAKTVLITGLNADYEIISETVILNGTNTVVTINEYLRVFELKVLSGTNAGAITATGDTLLQKTMATGANITKSSHYTIPNDCVGYLTTLEVAINLGKVTVNQKVDGVIVSSFTMDAALDTNYTTHTLYCEEIPEHSDVWLEATTDSNNTVVYSKQLLIIRDTTRT